MAWQSWWHQIFETDRRNVKRRTECLSEVVLHVCEEERWYFDVFQNWLYVHAKMAATLFRALAILCLFVHVFVSVGDETFPNSYLRQDCLHGATKFAFRQFSPSFKCGNLAVVIVWQSTSYFKVGITGESHSKKNEEFWNLKLKIFSRKIRFCIALLVIGFMMSRRIRFQSIFTPVFPAFRVGCSEPFRVMIGWVDYLWLLEQITRNNPKSTNQYHESQTHLTQV